MKTRNQDFLLGLVVLVFIGLFVGTILFVYPYSGAKTRTVDIRFRADDGAAPLKPGSPVSLGGAMQVGKVTGVRREIERSDTPGKPPQSLVILVTTEIEEELPIYTDCQITTDQPPVGGGGSVVIVSVGMSGKPLVGRGPVEGFPPQSMAAAISGLSRRLLAPDGLVDKLAIALDDKHDGSLMFKLSSSLSDINAMTTDLRMQLSASEQKALMSKILQVADNLQEMTASLRDQAAASNSAGMIAKVHAALDSLGDALREVSALVKDNRPALERTIGHVENMTETLDQEVVQKIKADFNREDAASLLGKLHASMNHLNTSLENIQTVTDGARGLMVVNRPLLQRTVENFKETSDQLNGAVREVLLQPWRLFNKPGEAEMQKSDVLQAARHFADAATKLNDASSKLEALLQATPEQTSVGAAEELQMVRESLKAAFERFRIAETYLFEKMK